MKLKPVEKRLPINKTPTAIWAYSAIFGCAGFACLCGAYIYFIKRESFLGFIKGYTNNNFFETNINNRKIKPVTDNAYRRYLEEKKAYSKELEEETKIRLEKIQQKLQQSKNTDNQASKDQSSKQSPQVNNSEKTTTTNKSVPENTKKSAPVDQENRAKWAYKRFVEITK